MGKLSDAEVQERHEALDGWEVRGDGLNKVYIFSSFAQAFQWMTDVAAFCEEIDHHPNWKNIVNRVAVTIYTHRDGGLTDLDFKLATRMDALFQGRAKTLS
jgi:4a-hydroxytetrahydrobiopterin dehydratase